MADTSILSVAGPGTSSDKSSGSRLLDDPPLPPGATRPAKKHMLDLMSRANRDPGDPGLGRDSANPFVRKMLALKNVERDIQSVVSSDPNLAAPMAQVLQAFQMAVLSSLQGSGGGGTASAIAPNLPPPPPGMGAPPAPVGPSPLPGPAVLPMPPPGA